MSRQTIVVVVLLLLLLAALGYIGYGAWSKSKLDEQTTLLNQGYQYGVQQTQIQLAAQVYQQAAACTPVPVNYNNKTLYMVTIGCPGTEALVQALQQQAAQTQAQQRTVAK